MNQQITPPRIRLLFLMEQLILGGAERRFYRIARDLPRDRFDIRIGILRTGGALYDEFARLGVPIVEFSRRSRYDLSPSQRLARYCVQERIDVVHAMLWLSSTFAAWAQPSMPGTAVIGSTVQDVYRTERFGRWRALSDRLVAHRLSTMVVNTPKLRDFLVRYGYPAKRITVIPNGIDIPDLAGEAALRQALHAQWGIAPDASCIGILAMLRPEKDHSTFLRAAEIVHQSLPGAHFIIAGDGPERERLEQMADAMALRDCVTFIGQVSGPAAAIPGWDVSVLSSRHEGMPNVVLEAMAWARPVVATDIQGVTDMVTDGVTGYVVPVADAAAMARQILALLAAPNVAMQMGQAGRERVLARWSVDRMVAEYQALYEASVVASSASNAHPSLRQGDRIS
jgi:glycosyltransferase involved in cell wall biosynthesis